MTLFRRAGVAALVAATLAVAAAAPIPAQEPAPITIAASANDSTTAGLYAVKAGLFKKAGLNVNLIAMNSGSAVAAAVAGGSVQIGNSSLLGVIEAHARHIPFTLVATSAMFDDARSRDLGLVVRTGSTIRTGRDLNGKTMAVPGLKDLNAFSAMAWIDKNGGDSSTVHFVEMPSAAALQAVVEGRIDATNLSTPLLTQGLKDGTVRALADPAGAISQRHLLLAWITTEDYAAAHRDEIERFARVMHDAAVYCNAHQAQTLGLIADFAKLDPAAVHDMQRVTFAPYLTAPLIQPLIDVAAKYKLIDAPFDAGELISPYALKPPPGQVR
jgi:NitT/TauT family transport system substrate-binding protein